MFLAILASGVILTSKPLHPNIRLGLSKAEWQGMVTNTNGHVSEGYVVVQQLRTWDGRTLVFWASTSELDPKGPNGIGAQVYSSSGVFQRWLKGSSDIDRKFILCGQYLVVEGDPLRVWDMKQPAYPITYRKPFPKGFDNPSTCANLH